MPPPFWLFLLPPLPPEVPPDTVDDDAVGAGAPRPEQKLVYQPWRLPRAPASAGAVHTDGAQMLLVAVRKGFNRSSAQKQLMILSLVPPPPLSGAHFPLTSQSGPHCWTQVGRAGKGTSVVSIAANLSCTWDDQDTFYNRRL